MKKPSYVKRELEGKIAKYARTFPAVVLSGPRQSGKSTTLKRLFGSTHQYVTFDDPVIRQKCAEDPKLFLDNLKSHVVFDEIQYVPQILSYLKIAIDEDRQKYGRYIITGSQQYNLIKELGDTLAGRVGLLTLLPFSYGEIVRVSRLKKRFFVPEKAFIYSCLNGCFPETIVRQGIDISGWYAGYLQTYLERDVRGLHNVGNLLDFQKFLQLLASRCSQTLNLSSFANDLGISVNTVKNWLSILSASQIIFLLSPYYRNIGKRVIKNPKIYFSDCGLITYLTGLKTKEHILNGPLAGALFENYVMSETYKAIANKGEVPKLFYLRTRKGMEIDLIMEKGLNLYPFEIKLTKSPKSGMVAAFENLYNTSLGIKIARGKLVCLIRDSLPLTDNAIAINMLDYFKEISA